MIAYYDQANYRVVFIGDSVYSVPIDRVKMHPELFDVPAIIASGFGRLGEVISGVKPVGNPYHPLPENGSATTDFAVPSVPSARLEFIVPSRDGTMILSKLSPELRFEGAHDGKEISQLKLIYGDLPEQVQALIRSGTLRLVSHSELNQLKQKQKDKERNKKDQEESRRKSARSVRRRDSDDVSDDGDDSSPVRNAIPIRL